MEYQEPLFSMYEELEQAKTVYSEPFEIFLVEAVEYQNSEGEIQYDAAIFNWDAVIKSRAKGFNSLPECLEALAETQYAKLIGWVP